MVWKDGKYDGLALVLIYYIDQYSPTPEHTVLVVDLNKKAPLWDRFVGGKIEHGEDPEQAAWREMEEETGLDIKDAITYGKLGETMGYNEFCNIRFPVHLYEAEFTIDYIEQSLLRRSEDGDLVKRVPIAFLPDYVQSFHPEHLKYLDKIDSGWYSKLFGTRD